MHTALRTWLPLLLVVVALGGCDGSGAPAVLPLPMEPTAASVSRFCGMLLVEHPGPKGQIFLEGRVEPVWFSSVSETVAFTMLPEEPAGVVAIYVNDLGKAKNWDHPEPGAWVEARRAWYVLGSDKRDAAGMGDSRKEPIPFSDEAGAERFRQAHGGRILRFADIPQDEILGSGATQSGSDVRSEFVSTPQGN